MMHRFARDRNGNIAILTAIVMPLMLMFTGGAIDFTRWNHERGELKELADTLATRGAREFLLANASAQQVKAVIDSVINSGFVDAYGLSDLTADVSVRVTEGEVSVHLTSQPAEALFLNKFEPFKSMHDVTSTAVAHGGMNVCVVALDEVNKGAVAATTNSKLLASKCSIMSNSMSTQGVVSSGASIIEAGLICSAGGSYGTAYNYAPLPTLDCPKYTDPLRERMPPVVGVCDEYDAAYGEMLDDVVSAAASTSENLVSQTAQGLGGGAVNGLTNGAGLSETTYTLEPGVYCGGLTIGALANVELNPGHYIIKDGPLLVGLGGKVSGENVSFYLVGDDSTFYFGPEAVISLTAPESGPLAGILFFEDRAAPVDREHRILSDDARILLGTFYLPRGILKVASLLPVADASAYTAIVAKKLEMAGNPTLVLNADYAATNIPVPDGVGPVGNTIYLRE